MNKIENNIVFKLKNKIINEISFGLNIVILHFKGGLIQFSGQFSTIINKKVNKYKEVYPVDNDFNLLKLLEKEIKDVLIDDNNLSLVFKGNTIITLYSDDYFESYKIILNEKENIV